MIVLTVTPEQCMVYRDGLQELAAWGTAEERAAAYALLDIHPTAEDVARMLADAQASAAALELRSVEGNKLVVDDPDPAPGMGMDVGDPGLN